MKKKATEDENTTTASALFLCRLANVVCKLFHFRVTSHNSTHWVKLHRKSWLCDEIKQVALWVQWIFFPAKIWELFRVPFLDYRV